MLIPAQQDDTHNHKILFCTQPIKHCCLKLASPRLSYCFSPAISITKHAQELAKRIVYTPLEIRNKMQPPWKPKKPACRHRQRRLTAQGRRVTLGYGGLTCFSVQLNPSEVTERLGKSLRMQGVSRRRLYRWGLRTALKHAYT